MKTAAGSDSRRRDNGKAALIDIEKRQRLALFWKARDQGPCAIAYAAKETPLDVLMGKAV